MRLASGSVAHPVVDQPQARGHPAQGVGVDRDVGGEALLEQAQDVDRVAEGVGVDEVEAAVVETVALAGRVLAAREDRAQLGAEAGLRLHVARLEGGEEDAGQVADVLGVGEIVLHEPLDRPQRPGRAVAERVGDLDLGVEGQLLAGPAVQQVQVHAGGPEEVAGLGEDPVLLGGEHPHLGQVLGRLGAVQVLGEPVERLQVAQPALALLDVRLEQVARAALPLRAAPRARRASSRRTAARCRRRARPRAGRRAAAPAPGRPRRSGARAGWCGSSDRPWRSAGSRRRCAPRGRPSAAGPRGSRARSRSGSRPRASACRG